MTVGCQYPNCGPSHTFYNFEATIPVAQGVSSFTVEVVDNTTGSSTIHNNGGSGFPLSDAIQPQLARSVQTLIFDPAFTLPTQLNLTVAVSNMGL